MSNDMELNNLMGGKCPLLTSCSLPKKDSCSKVAFFRLCPEYLIKRKKILTST
ncbi:MAG: hypothetical protein ACFFAT_12540 [Promethearchaeota archaeon]